MIPNGAAGLGTVHSAHVLAGTALIDEAFARLDVTAGPRQMRSTEAETPLKAVSIALVCHPLL